MNRENEFWRLLEQVQEAVSEQYADVLADAAELPRLKARVEKYLRESGCTLDEYTAPELVDRLCREMAGYSVLTPYLGREDVNEINVNAWNDVAVTFADGHTEKLAGHFRSPQHAVDVVRRLLHSSGMILDNATPVAQGHLPGNTRVTAMKEPVVDAERGVAASIRLLHPKRITGEELVRTGFATREMIDFLCLCVQYGVSHVVAGATDTGKTTLLNCLLQSVPDEKRVFTIESGARELSLVREQDGRALNNVVHTLSRPSDNPAFHFDQSDLVEVSLRFNPDVVCVGEMLDQEAYSAVEASLTGHTVVSSVHAGGCAAAHMRIALLCQRRYPIDFDTSLLQAAQAFPVVVFTHKLGSKRRIMEVAEAEITPDGGRLYHPLYAYRMEASGGAARKPERMSESLRRRFLQYGAPVEELERFCRQEE